MADPSRLTRNSPLFSLTLKLKKQLPFNEIESFMGSELTSVLGKPYTLSNSGLKCVSWKITPVNTFVRFLFAAENTDKLWELSDTLYAYRKRTPKPLIVVICFRGDKRNFRMKNMAEALSEKYTQTENLLPTFLNPSSKNPILPAKNYPEKPQRIPEPDQKYRNFYENMKTYARVKFIYSNEVYGESWEVLMDCDEITPKQKETIKKRVEKYKQEHPEMMNINGIIFYFD